MLPENQISCGIHEGEVRALLSGNDAPLHLSFIFVLNAHVNVRKTYTDEFKRQAIRLATERGNVVETARDLGIADVLRHR